MVSEKQSDDSPGLPTFVLEATRGLDDLIEEFELEEPPAWTESAKKLNAMSSRELEGISTVLFLRLTVRAQEPVHARLLTLKPRFEDIVDNCIARAEELQFAA